MVVRGRTYSSTFVAACQEAQRTVLRSKGVRAHLKRERKKERKKEGGKGPEDSVAVKRRQCTLKKRGKKRERKKEAGKGPEDSVCGQKTSVHT